MNDRIPIDAVIVDYGEVLSRPADPHEFSQMARLAGIEPARLHELYWRFREAYDRGNVDGVSFWTLVADAAGTSFSRVQVESLIERDVTMWTRLNEPVIEWVLGLVEDGYRVALLSNMVPEIGRHLRVHMPFLQRFAHLTMSCELGVVKPERAIYERTLEGLGVTASRALLIDDRPVNIAGAQEVGMHGLVFRGLEATRAEFSERFIVGA